MGVPEKRLASLLAQVVESLPPPVPAPYIPPLKDLVRWSGGRFTKDDFGRIADAVIHAVTEGFEYLYGTRTLAEWHATLAPGLELVPQPFSTPLPLNTPALRLSTPTGETPTIAYFMIPLRGQWGMARLHYATHEGSSGVAFAHLDVVGFFEEMQRHGSAPHICVGLIYQTVLQAVLSTEVHVMRAVMVPLVRFGEEVRHTFKVHGLPWAAMGVTAPQ